MVEVDLGSIGVAVAVALAYVFYGLAVAKSKGHNFSAAKALASVGAAIFLAIFAPELIPSDPASVFELPVLALTAFQTFGALYVLQKGYAIAYEVYERLADLIHDILHPASEEDE